MIFRRLLLAAMAISALTACLAGILVALILAAFLALEPWLGPAGAAGCLALALGMSLALAALVAGGALWANDPKPSRRRAEGGHGLTALVETRPILSVVLAVGTGLVAAVNPSLLRSAARVILKTGATSRRG